MRKVMIDLSAFFPDLQHFFWSTLRFVCDQNSWSRTISDVIPNCPLDFIKTQTPIVTEIEDDDVNISRFYRGGKAEWMDVMELMPLVHQVTKCPVIAGGTDKTDSQNDPSHCRRYTAPNYQGATESIFNLKFTRLPYPICGGQAIRKQFEISDLKYITKNHFWGII